MNELTTQPPSQSSASQDRLALTTELGKMLGLVAPVTMSADQQTLWLASAVDTLDGISAREVAAVSTEVRRTVTWPSQIVPEISKRVTARRAREARIADVARIDAPRLPSPDLVDASDIRKLIRRMGSKA